MGDKLCTNTPTVSTEAKLNPSVAKLNIYVVFLFDRSWWTTRTTSTSAATPGRRSCWWRIIMIILVSIQLLRAIMWSLWWRIAGRPTPGSTWWFRLGLWPASWFGHTSWLFSATRGLLFTFLRAARSTSVFAAWSVSACSASTSSACSAFALPGSRTGSRSGYGDSNNISVTSARIEHVSEDKIQFQMHFNTLHNT